jgi:N-methylhydantoinase A
MSNIGIDTGGTFCDLVHIDGKGRAAVYKTHSTPTDTAQSVFEALELARAGSKTSPRDFYPSVESIALGTTIATNTVITHSGAKVGLLITRGHGDMLSIMRVTGRVAGRPLHEVQNYAATDKPASIVPKRWIAEIDERIDYTGDVIVPIKDAQVEEAVDRLVASGVESIAVSFLWGFLNPQHERRVREIVARRHPNIFISLGSELARRLGEYERTEAAVLNAYVALAVSGHLRRVVNGLGRKGVTVPLMVMHSAGGVATDGSSRERPIATLYSGPAGGIIASMRVADVAGYQNVICTDVGGTTFDVGLVVKGRPLLRSTSIIDQRVMYCPTIDIVSIGAGGGSIARVDQASGRLLVGPQSAGAAPGPACYGQGGEYPTVTDANLVLSYMDPERFLGGRLRLDRRAAEVALERYVAKPLGITVGQAAAGIFSIVNAKMADLVRKVSVERGHDPRDFVLCAYGGLGPLHSPFYAADLNTRAVIVPLGEISSVFSAYGIAMADILHVHELSRNLGEPFDRATVEEVFGALEREANAQLTTDGVSSADRLIRHFLEVRYVGQLNELTVEVPTGPLSDFDIRNEFERHYAEAFGPGAAWPQAPVEIVGFRVEAVGKRGKFSIAPQRPIARNLESRGRRQVYWPKSRAYIETPIYDGQILGPGSAITGPAVLEFATTTVVIPEEWSCRGDDLGNLILNPQSR